MSTALRSTPAPPPVMRPGAYIQMRRLSAGFTIEEVALALAQFGADTRPEAVRDGLALTARAVRAVEQDLAVPDGRLLARLGNLFRFDLRVYDELAAILVDPHADLPRPMVCRGCGCSWHDACSRPGYDACAWADTPDGEAPLCTHCQLRSPSNDA